jgi:hypothetical protein
LRYCRSLGLVRAEVAKGAMARSPKRDAVPAIKNSFFDRKDETQEITDSDAFLATIQQLDGEWLLNGGKDWRWHRTSLKVRDCEIQIGYSQSGLITEGASINGSRKV